MDKLLLKTGSSPKKYKKTFREYISDFSLFLVLKSFYIFSKIHGFVCLIFFPVTKYLVERKLGSFGIEINGKKSTDIKVFNTKRFYIRVACERSYGLLESILDGDCEVQDFRSFIGIIFSSRRHKELVHPLYWIFNVFNLQTPAKAFEVGKLHYDDGGYWKTAKTLDQAQLDKMDLIARKLDLKPGMRVLDIGSGFGTLCIYLAKNYNVSVVGCSVSIEQIKYAKKLAKSENLSNCTFLCQDYREMTGSFDRIVTVGFLEHVGIHNYDTFFKLCRHLLVDDGLFLLHTISHMLTSVCPKDLWLHEYIFRNGYSPHYLEIFSSIKDLWCIEDVQNIGFDYSKTITEWEKNFDRNWPKFEPKYGPRFHKMWKMYLKGASSVFETRSLHCLQIVLSKDGLRGGYHAAR